MKRPEPNAALNVTASVPPEMTIVEPGLVVSRVGEITGNKRSSSALDVVDLKNQSGGCDLCRGLRC